MIFLNNCDVRLREKTSMSFSRPLSSLHCRLEGQDRRWKHTFASATIGRRYTMLCTLLLATVKGFGAHSQQRLHLASSHES